MSESRDSDGLISEEELTVLTGLFFAFEGAPDPLTQKCKEAKVEFGQLVSKLYFERIEPNPKFRQFTSSQFHSLIRNCCRQRISKAGSQFLCP